MFQAAACVIKCKISWSKPLVQHKKIVNYDVNGVRCSLKFVWFSTGESSSVYIVWLFSLSSLYSRSFGFGPNSLKSTNMVLFCSSLFGKSSCLEHVTPQASQKLAITHTRKPLKNDTMPQVSTTWLEDCGNFPDQYNPKSTQPMNIKTKGRRQITHSWCGVFQLQKSCHLDSEVLEWESVISTVTFSRIVSAQVAFQCVFWPFTRIVHSNCSPHARVFYQQSDVARPKQCLRFSCLLKYNATAVWSIDPWRHCHANSVLMMTFWRAQKLKLNCSLYLSR